MAAPYASVTLPVDDGVKRVLVTGGAGYIGSHTVIELINAGYKITVVDNLVNSSPESLNRVNTITGKPEALTFVQGDVRDEHVLSGVLSAAKHSAVIHFAALKAVGESIQKPLEYYSNNIDGLLSVLGAAKAFGVKQIVFSSSATVYGTAAPPFTEATTVGQGVTNPYGQTKFMAEIVLKDFALANPGFAVACLRYFNPVGAHPSGLIGEDPKGIPNNLMPYIQRVAAGLLPQLTVHGNDYPTPDGTAQRDYIHVVDLARGHLKAVQWLEQRVASPSTAGFEAINLGTGTPYSVLDVVAAFEKASGKPVKHTIGPRRPGDLGTVYADASKAAQLLGWHAELGLDRMCEDSWRWVSKNPYGYNTAPPQA